MILQLAGVSIALQSKDEKICAAWKAQFGSFIVPQSAASPAPDITLVAHHVTELPALPDIAPFFIDKHVDAFNGEYCILHAFRPNPTTTLLHFLDGGIAILPHASNEPQTIEIWLTDNIFQSGRFEDMTFVSLQPALRAHGRYLIHASGVVRDGKALLIVGTSGSGKTTTCINLVLNGWQMLANDVVIIEERGNSIFAWPVPDNITIRPKTFTLIPKLRDFPFGERSINHQGQPEDTLPSYLLVGDNWAQPSPVALICFPTICEQRETSFSPQIGAIALALLMQESVDLWDRDALGGHTRVLDQLTRQASCISANLGNDLAEQRQQFGDLMTKFKHITHPDH